MRLAALALVLAVAPGCAQLLGLDDTRFDPKDAPTDAPSVCDDTPFTCTSTTGRTVCGQLYETGDKAGLALRTLNPTGASCEVGNIEAPCNLSIAGLPMASYFAGSTTGRVTAVVDDCGRYVVHDLDPAATDIAIVVEATNYKRTASLLLGRPAGVGIDSKIDALVVTELTLSGWTTQAGSNPDMSEGYLVQYTTTNAAPLSGEQVAKDGGSPFSNPVGTVPWASYFTGTAPFAAIDAGATTTLETGTAFAVLGPGTFSLDGFRPGRRCRIMNLQQVANTLIYVSAPNC